MSVDGTPTNLYSGAGDKNLIAISQQDAIDHPEKYPYNSFSNGSQALWYCCIQRFGR